MFFCARPVKMSFKECVKVKVLTALALGVAKNPELAILLIVVMAILAAYQIYAYNKGWFDGQ